MAPGHGVEANGDASKEAGRGRGSKEERRKQLAALESKVLGGGIVVLLFIGARDSNRVCVRAPSH